MGSPELATSPGRWLVTAADRTGHLVAVHPDRSTTEGLALALVLGRFWPALTVRAVRTGRTTTTGPAPVRTTTTPDLANRSGSPDARTGPVRSAA